VKEYIMKTRYKTIIFVVGLYVLFDHCVRIYRNIPYLSQEAHAVLRRYEPNQNRRITPQNAENVPFSTYSLRTNSDGFIAEVDEGECYFLGGSTTECLYVREYNRFPVIVGKTLCMKTVNCGRSGNNSIHSLNLLLNVVLKRKPSVVVLMHNINDLIVLGLAGTYWNNTTRSNVVQIRKHPIRDAFSAMLPCTERLIRFSCMGADEWGDIRGVNVTLDKDSICSSFRKNIETFVFICKSHGIRPVLMTQQNRFTDNPDKDIEHAVAVLWSDFGIDYRTFISVYKSMNEEIRKCSFVNGITCVDLDRAIPKTSEFIYDVCHLSESGSLLAGKLIAERML